MDFIECGEEAEILLNEEIYKNSSIQLTDHINILFGKSNSIIKKVKQVYNLNIIDFKIIIRDYIKFLSVLLILYWIYWLVL